MDARNKATYTVKGIDLRHGGTVYPEGSHIELAPEEAEALKAYLEPSDDSEMSDHSDDLYELHSQLHREKEDREAVERQLTTLQEQLATTQSELATTKEQLAAAEEKLAVPLSDPSEKSDPPPEKGKAKGGKN